MYPQISFWAFRDGPSGERSIVEAMRLAKQSADEAVRRAEFHRALEIMESLNHPIATKKFQDYIKKLKDIDAIVTPHQP